MKLAIATCKDNSQLTADDRALARRLVELGIEVWPLVWSDPASIKNAFNCNGVLIRSVWDYHLRMNEFCLWLDQLEATGVRIFNSPETIRWNLDKIYLNELASAGIPCVPTLFLSQTMPLAEARRELDARQWQEIVIKPTISAGSYLTFRMQSLSTEFENKLMEIQQHSGAMVQPYLQEIEGRGEVSLVFFNHQGQVLSHAVNKLPRKNEFRVQHDFGGYEVPMTASTEIVDFADSCLKLVPGTWLSARVDILNWSTSPVLSEIELIEPDLFFRYHPSSVNQFANLLNNTINHP
jgi:glutathione synthase/RimK-type ligase-like ATP-grasp enzyme